MGAASIYVEQNTLDHWLCDTAIPSPPTPYLALFTSITGLEENTIESADEISGGSYDRVSVVGKFDPASAESEVILNDTIEFPEATADWGTATHYAIMDGNTLGSGNILFHGELDRSRTILEGDVFRVRTGNLKVTMD